MGVSIEQWRIRIGLFGGKMKVKNPNLGTNYSVLLACVTMAMAIMTLLLLIGSYQVAARAPILAMMLDNAVSSTSDITFTLTGIRFAISAHLVFSCAHHILLLLPLIGLSPNLKLQHMKCIRRRQKFGESLNLLAVLAAASVVVYLLAIGNIERNPGPFPCNICTEVPQTIASNIRHQHYHSMDKHFTYHCPSPDCAYSTNCFGSITNHVSAFHRKTKHQDPASSVSYPCLVSKCDVSSPSFWNLIQHFYRHLENNVEIPSCPYANCKFPKPFKKKANLQVHLAQTHSGWQDEGIPKKKLKLSTAHSTSNTSTSMPIIEDHIDSLNTEEFDTEYDSENDIDPPFLNDSLVYDCIAKFYLKLYGEYFLPYKLIQEISEGLSFLLNITHSRIKFILSQELKKEGLSDHKIGFILFKTMRSDLMFSSHRKDFPGPSFTSDYLRKTYFKEHLNFKPPTEISLDQNYEKTDKKYQYVPPQETLTTLLEDPSVQKEIDQSFQEQPPQHNGIISNYTEGQQFVSENHPRKEIHLFVYQDGFNPVMNVLGSAKNKFKDLAVYFTIGNLRFSLRSKVASKHLLMLIRESVLKTVGATRCFKKLKEDLTKLEQNGIPYKSENIKVVVQYSIGDNLGQHFFGGFVGNFSGEFFCRFCNIKRKKFKKHPSVTNPLRTKMSYNQCVMKARLRNMKSCQGIKHDSTFNELTYFHSSTHLSPCLAHDLFEGVVSWDLAGIISKFINLKWFNYELLNKRIRKFKCVGTDKPNKPACVNVKGAKLGGHAVQNWTLLRLLPFIIGDKIQDLENDAWKLYLQLKELSEYFCGPQFAVVEVSYIKDVLLPQYFEQRSKVLRPNSVRPKHHFMCHYPELMLKYGPLIHLWTLPFEQKHKMFKSVCRLSRNFKNVEYTCATRHQLNLAYLGTGELFPEETTEYKAKEFSPYIYIGHLLSFIMDLNIEEGWRESESLFKDGITYNKGDLLLLSANGTTITAGFIRVILSKGCALEFILQISKALFIPSYGVYQLPPDRTEVYRKVSRESLQHPVPQPLYLLQSVQCFSPKYKLVAFH